MRSSTSLRSSESCTRLNMGIWEGWSASWSGFPSRSWRSRLYESSCALGRTGMDHVAGYSVFFDITARDLQAKAREEGSPWTAAKGFDTFAPVSEAVAADPDLDPHRLPIRLRVNGAVRQDSNTNQMVFRIPQ